MDDHKELEKLNDFYKTAMDKAHEWGLEPYETQFHIVPNEKLYEIASYGVPNHYNHWSYGRDYWRQKTAYDHGMSRIYELVINADPAQAFLLDTNSILHNQFVIAHVIGHSDFFANNEYFAHTNKNIEVSAAATAARFRQYEMEHGTITVEKFIDDVKSIEEHISPHLRTKKKEKEYETSYPEHEYIDLHPLDQVEILMDMHREELAKDRFPLHPERDVMRFIADNSKKLEDWQRDIIMSIREEMIYFLPQMQTKIMNEGWASICHHRLMHALDPETDPGGIDFADTHSSVLNGRPGQINPYWLGYNMYKRIEDKVNEEEKWEGDNFWESPGWAACLDVRRYERDESFLRDELDEKLCEDLDLFSFGFDEAESVWYVTSKEWEKVRDNLVKTKSNMGLPYITVEDADHLGQGVLLLKHAWEGKPLKRKYAEKTLIAVARLWGKDVVLQTQRDEDAMLHIKASFSSSGEATTRIEVFDI